MDTKILIALITGSVGILTAILSSVLSYKQSKKIAKLNKELETKKVKDEEIIKFILTYDTQNINQSILHLKDYLKITQYNKDKIKELINNCEKSFSDELKQELTKIKNEIIEQYSKSVYYFNKVDTEKYAHSIKNIFCDIIDKLDSDVNSEKDQLFSMIKIISEKQYNLQLSIEHYVDEMLNKLKNQSQ
jgi:hypothetical protein